MTPPPFLISSVDIASQQPPPLTAAPTTISDLSDDLLREVFLHLPSLPSLVRTALTCPAFLRAVRSSPALRHPFRELHPPLLLGVFLDIHDLDLPVCAPIRRRSDPDHAAAIRGADVFFTLLPEYDNDLHPEWSMKYCRDRFGLLDDWTVKQMAFYNPLTRSVDIFPTPPDEICSDMFVEFHMLASEGFGAQAAVLSSDSKEWKVFPFSEGGFFSLNGTLVNGSVYWTITGGANIHMLNATPLQFSQIEPPLHMEGQEKFKPGETKDGRLCLGCTVKHTLVVWVWRPDDSGVNIWMLDKTFPLDTRYFLDDDVSLNVVAIIGGFVYLTTFCERRPNSCHFMCFCLETEELNKLCTVTHSITSYPYIMAFPPSLICNKVNPQLKGA